MQHNIIIKNNNRIMTEHTASSFKEAQRFIMKTCGYSTVYDYNIPFNWNKDHYEFFDEGTKLSFLIF